MIMAYLYRKNRSPFWYIQYVDSDRKKHDKSTGFRADDPNDTVKGENPARRVGDKGVSASAGRQRRCVGHLGPEIPRETLPDPEDVCQI